MTIRFAVTVEPFLTPATPTWIPFLTSLTCAVFWCATIRSLVPNAQVWVNPSADFTVTELLVTAVTSPRWPSTALSPSLVCPTTSPCSTCCASSRRSVGRRTRSGFAEAEADGDGSPSGARSGWLKPTAVSAAASGVIESVTSVPPHAARPSRVTAPRAAVASATRIFMGGPFLTMMGPASARLARVASVRRSGLVNRQLYREPRATLARVPRLDGAAEPAHQPVRECQPQSGADLAHPAVPLGHRPALEHQGQVGVREPRPAVADLDGREAACVRRPDRQHDRRTGRPHPDGVVQQPVHDLPQPARVGLHGHRLGRELHAQRLAPRHPRAGRVAHQLDEVHGQHGDREVD